MTDLVGVPQPAQPGGPPIMVGGGGRRLLSMAAKNADIVQVLGATLGTGRGGPSTSPAFGPNPSRNVWTGSGPQRAVGSMRSNYR